MRKASFPKKIIILVLILAVPGFLYYLLTAKGKNRYKPLPFYGPKQVAKTGHKYRGKFIPDTIYHKLGAFKLIDQDGNEVTDKSFDKKLMVVSFFYTGCPTVCNEVNKNLSGLDSVYRKNKMVRLVSLTVNPEHDTAPLLKKYAGQFNPGPNWKFLTGDTTTIYNIARKGLLVDALKVDDNNFIYSDKVMLVDAEKRIRGYYSGTSLTDLNRLNEEIRVQIAEELRKVDKALY